MRRRYYTVKRLQRLAERLSDEKAMELVEAIQRSVVFGRWRVYVSVAGVAAYVTRPVDEFKVQNMLREHVNERMPR